MQFKRNSNSYTKEEYKQARNDLRIYKEIKLDELYRKDKKSFLYNILDSSLIFQSKFKKYDIKVIQCGDYFQVYRFGTFHLTKDKNITGFDKIRRFIKTEKESVIHLSKKEKLEVLELKKFYSSPLYKNSFIKIKNLEELKIKYNIHDSIIKDSDNSKYKVIDLKNINRSKICMQRLVKSNEEVFKTFTTLTFKDNIVDIEQANKKLNIWLTYLRQLKPDLKYIGVPEFQKGREVKYGFAVVHYHLLTNIDYNDFSILSEFERKIWKKNSKKYQIGRDIKGWSYGHNMTIKLDNINVVAYMTKYMTKDIDNRLWGKRRYFNSHNLRKPSIVYLDTDKIEELIKYYNILDLNLKFSKEYQNVFNENIVFEEYKIGSI